MYYGLTAAWLILVVYLITLVSRERKIRAEIDRMKRMIESGERR
jgi:hypothetical protein